MWWVVTDSQYKECTRRVFSGACKADLGHHCGKSNFPKCDWCTLQPLNLSTSPFSPPFWDLPQCCICFVYNYNCRMLGRGYNGGFIHRFNVFWVLGRRKKQYWWHFPGLILTIFGYCPALQVQAYFLNRVALQVVQFSLLDLKVLALPEVWICSF